MIASTISACATALVPYLPMRRPSPERMRSRIESKLLTAAPTSSSKPIARLPPIQTRSVGAPATSSNTDSSPKSTKTNPSAPKSAA